MKGSAKKGGGGADANTHGAHILPGCGDDNGDAHRETLIVDTAFNICVQLKLDVPHHGISQQEQLKTQLTCTVHAGRAPQKSSLMILDTQS